MPQYNERGSNLDKCLFLYLSIIYQKPIKYSMEYPPLPPSIYKMGVQV